MREPSQSLKRARVLSSVLVALSFVLICVSTRALAEPVTETERISLDQEEVEGQEAAEGTLADEPMLESQTEEEMENGTEKLETGTKAPKTADGEGVLSAQTTWQASGTCEWSLTDGELVVRPKNGVEGTLESWTCYDEVPWCSMRLQIESVRFEGAVHAQTCNSMFSDCPDLSLVDVARLDVSCVTDMDYMFRGCSNLSSLDVSGWDTSSVTSMVSMFYRCSSLKALDLSGWDNSSVTGMDSMFSGCSSLKALDLSGWDNSSATGMDSMFRGCSNLSSLDVSGWDTSSVTDMGYMFDGCSNLASLDVSGWDTSRVRDMSDMFNGCSNLASLDVSGWDTSRVWNMSRMFSGCSNLSSLAVSDWDTSSVEMLTNLFEGCKLLKTIDLSSWNTSSVWDMSGLFNGCTSLIAINLSSWSTSNIGHGKVYARPDGSPWGGSMTYMFDGCSSLAKICVGEGYKPFISDGFPVPCGIEANKWWSTKDLKWYTKDQIVSMRSGIADVYTATETTSSAKAFPDVKQGSWYYQVVNRAADLGLISGYDNGTFGPDDPITRGQVAVILWRMAGQPKAGAGAKSFSDVKSGAYYYAAVRWASGAGVVNGYAGGNFGPNDKVTREQLAVMLANYASKVAGRKVTGSKADFASMSDASKVSSWAQPAVGWCFRNKILSGSNGKVLPQGDANRAQAAKMLVFLYNMLN